MKNAILVVGQLPPPVHGSNLMTQFFLTALEKLERPFFLVEKNFSLTQTDVGKLHPLKLIKIPSLLFRLLKACENSKYEMCVFFISLGPISFLLDALLLAIIRLFRIKYVLYIHGLGVKNLAQNTNCVISWVTKKVFKNAHGALILGKNLKKDVVPYIKDERLFVLPNAIPDNKMRYLKSNKLCLKTDDITVLYLSNLRPAKGTMDFLEMAKKIHAKRKNVVFKIAGPYRDIEFYNQLQQVIKNENLEECVEILGEVHGKSKADLYAHSDVFVFPSHQEALPLVNLEAMQWGLPIVTTCVGSVPEIVRDKINGFVVSPRDIKALTDRVITLIDDDDLRMKMGQAGRELYEKYYTIDKYINNLRQAFVFFNSLENSLT